MFLTYNESEPLSKLTDHQYFNSVIKTDEYTKNPKEKKKPIYQT